MNQMNCVLKKKHQSRHCWSAIEDFGTFQCVGHRWILSFNRVATVATLVTWWAPQGGFTELQWCPDRAVVLWHRAGDNWKWLDFWQWLWKLFLTLMIGECFIVYSCWPKPKILQNCLVFVCFLSQWGRHSPLYTIQLLILAISWSDEVLEEHRRSLQFCVLCSH